MKKIIVILIVLIPFLCFSQTYKTNSTNNKFTGYNWFTQSVRFGSNTYLSESSIINFQSTYTLVNTTKTNWNTAYTLVTTGKSIWDYAYTAVTNGKPNWDNVYVEVQSKKGNWDYAYSQINDTIDINTAITGLSYLAIPALTTTQINSLQLSGRAIVYDKTANALKIYNGTAWKELLTK